MEDVPFLCLLPEDELIDTGELGIRDINCKRKKKSEI